MTEHTSAEKAPYHPDEDGTTHIRLAIDAKTSLGQALHLGAYRPFVDPEYGPFDSIVAFMIWYDNGRRDSLRAIHHDVMIRSSMAGLNSTVTSMSEATKVLRNSVLNDNALASMLRQSELPFAMYESIQFEGRDSVSIYPLPDREWYVRALEDLRKELKS